MNLRKLVGLFAFLALTAWTVSAQLPNPSETRPGDISIKNIRQSQTDSPNYGSAEGSLGGRPSTLWRKWLKIEVQFDSKPEWADDIQLKYHVLMGKGRDAKLFTGSVTLINVAKGSAHYSAMFIHPNTLKRFGGGQVEAVAVQLYHHDRLLSTESDPPTNTRWWEQYTPQTGYLLAPQDSPWAPVADQRYEAAKPIR